MTSAALRIVQKYHPKVSRVTDARYDATIQVTERDCKTSKAKAPDSCALATAFCRKHDGAIISTSIAYLIDGNKATRYRVPESISREVISFDRGQFFVPGTYTLKAPVSTEKLNVIRAEKRWNDPKYHVPNRKVRRAHKTTGIRSL